MRPGTRHQPPPQALLLKMCASLLLPNPSALCPAVAGWRQSVATLLAAHALLIRMLTGFTSEVQACSVRQGHPPSSNSSLASTSQPAGAAQQHNESGSRAPPQHPAEDAGAHGGHGQAVGRSSRASSIQDSEAGRMDADLEASVLDTLTDSVLTGACSLGRRVPEDACMRQPWDNLSGLLWA